VKFMVIARPRQDADAGEIRDGMTGEREHTRRLRDEGRISAAYLSADEPAVFLVFEVTDANELSATLAEFPLYRLLQWDVVPLGSSPFESTAS